MGAAEGTQSGVVSMVRGAMDALSWAPADERKLCEEVLPGSTTWNDVDALVRGRMKPKHVRRYRYRLLMTRLFRIVPTEMHEGQRRRCQPLGKPTLLFHGTAPRNAESIILSGFKLPRKRGMFGRGLYFAKDPLKSVNFSKEDVRPRSLSFGTDSSGVESSSHSTSLGGRFFSQPFFTWIFGSAPSQERVRHILICDVFLGKSRTLRRAHAAFEPEKGLQPPFWRRLAGTKKFHSVRAPGGVRGAVRVSEYVVYQEYQCIPRYLMEFGTESVP